MGTVYISIVHWLQAHMLSCPSKRLLHFDCPGCGLQRSVIALLKGDIIGSWRVYPPGVFIVITIVFLSLHLLFGFRNGAVILKTLFIISAIIVVANYLYKIIKHFA